jgi:hypothetical protein
MQTIKTVHIGIEFNSDLSNRDETQGDGSYTAVDFRDRFLKEAESPEFWDGEQRIELDFASVSVLAPSFANEVFAYYAPIARDKEAIFAHLHPRNISDVKLGTIMKEIDKGYRGRRNGPSRR